LRLDWIRQHVVLDGAKRPASPHDAAIARSVQHHGLWHG
jgi:hypothetical protein